MIYETDKDRPVTELERILLGWDDFQGKTLIAHLLTPYELLALANKFGKPALEEELKHLRQSSLAMSRDVSMNDTERSTYRREAEELQVLLNKLL